MVSSLQIPAKTCSQTEMDHFLQYISPDLISQWSLTRKLWEEATVNVIWQCEAGILLSNLQPSYHWFQSNTGSQRASLGIQTWELPQRGSWTFNWGLTLSTTQAPFTKWRKSSISYRNNKHVSMSTLFTELTKKTMITLVIFPKTGSVFFPLRPNLNNGLYFSVLDPRVSPEVNLSVLGKNKDRENRKVRRPCSNKWTLLLISAFVPQSSAPQVKKRVISLNWTWHMTA